MATAVLLAFLAAIGAGPGWLGAIEGIADGLSSFAEPGAGHYTDQLKRRKPLAVFGYAFYGTGYSFVCFCHARLPDFDWAGLPRGWAAVCVRPPRRRC